MAGGVNWILSRHGNFYPTNYVPTSEVEAKRNIAYALCSKMIHLMIELYAVKE